MKIDFFNLASSIGVLGKKIGLASYQLFILYAFMLILIITTKPIDQDNLLFLQKGLVFFLFLWHLIPLHIIGIFIPTIRRE